MASEIKSYTAAGAGNASTWTELKNLLKGVRRAKRNLHSETKSILSEIRRLESSLYSYFGVELHGKEILEIGVGQLPRQVAYLGVHNRVVGIDLDVIPQGFRFWQYYSLMRNNGSKRLLKTLIRKLLGMDRGFRKQLMELLDIDRIPNVQLRVMDAKNMTFQDCSFDFVCSFNVFEHLPDPAGVLKEIVRVLRPGGCVACHFHLYTSDSGCHDLKILSGDRQKMPFWPHLRPSFAGLVENAAYINGLRIERWMEIFSTELPGSKVEFWKDPDFEVLSRELDIIRSEGDLQEYSDDELLTRVCVFYWQKPKVGF